MKQRQCSTSTIRVCLLGHVSWDMDLYERKHQELLCDTTQCCYSNKRAFCWGGGLPSSSTCTQQVHPFPLEKSSTHSTNKSFKIWSHKQKIKFLKVEKHNILKFCFQFILWNPFFQLLDFVTQLLLTWGNRSKYIEN